MKRFFLVAILSMTAAVLVPVLGVLWQTVAPGGGRGFLIDKHVTAKASAALSR